MRYPEGSIINIDAVFTAGDFASIELSIDNGTSWLIIDPSVPIVHATVDNQEVYEPFHYEWMCPFVPLATCYIRVEGWGVASNQQTSIGPFEIYAPPPAIPEGCQRVYGTITKMSTLGASGQKITVETLSKNSLLAGKFITTERDEVETDSAGEFELIVPKNTHALFKGYTRAGDQFLSIDVPAISNANEALLSSYAPQS